MRAARHRAVSGAFLGALSIVVLSQVFLRAQSAPEQAPLTRAEIEQFLRSAEIQRLRPVGEGVTNSLRATLTDGSLTHDAHVQAVDEQKPIYMGNRGPEIGFMDSYEFNIAAYLLDQLLGLDMVPVSVERQVRGRTAAVTWWVDDVMMDEGERVDRGVPVPPEWHAQMHIVNVFDQLIHNTDRNRGNLVYTSTWKVWMIDHTRAFRLQSRLLERPHLARCERTLFERLQALDEETLTQTLGRYLSSGQIRALLTRRDLIVQHFEDLVERFGPERVFYTIEPPTESATRPF